MQRVKLRAMEPDDINVIYRWENDPAIWVYSAAHQPFSRHTLEKFIEESACNDIYTSRQLRLMADSNDITIVCIDLYDYDPFHRRAAIGILIDKGFRNKGFGTAILKEIESFSATHLNIHLLYCCVAEDNTASIRLFKGCGFHETGVKKEWLWDGEEWTDAIELQKIIAQ